MRSLWDWEPFQSFFHYLLNCHWDPGTVKSQISELFIAAPSNPLPAVTITGLPKWTLLWYIPHPWLCLSWFMEGPMVILKLLLASNSQTVSKVPLSLLKFKFLYLCTYLLAEANCSSKWKSLKLPMPSAKFWLKIMHYYWNYNFGIDGNISWSHLLFWL